MLAYGDPMPALELTDTGGRRVPLDSFRKKRHVAFLFFRGTW